MKAEGRTIGDLIEPRREKAVPSGYPDLPYVGLEHIEAHPTRLIGSVPSTRMRSTTKRFYSGDVRFANL
jgi:type I restriction enzyme, S subunit